MIEDPLVDIITFLHTAKSEISNQFFGDIKDREVYDFIKSYQPYNLEIKPELENLLITSTKGHMWEDHSRRLVAKIRRELNDSTNYNRIFYK